MAKDEKLAKELFDAIASESGWPQDVTDKVTVTMNPNGINLTYDEALDNKIFDLEYGKFHEPPRPAIRKFKARSSNIVDKIALDRISEKLKGQGVI